MFLNIFKVGSAVSVRLNNKQKSKHSHLKYLDISDDDINYKIIAWLTHWLTKPKQSLEIWNLEGKFFLWFRSALRNTFLTLKKMGEWGWKIHPHSQWGVELCMENLRVAEVTGAFH